MKFIYEVISDTKSGMKREEFHSVDEITSKYTLNGFKEHAMKQELQGQPRFFGLLGPMYNGVKNGVPVIRYETQVVYNALSI
ncbi:hypothetical protein [Bacillus sp. NPDC094106]|uniref:hypothetical protein n=1 Tax=Bacillus sp. NPDC094106 TaxID=3363949 RepID=UPI00380D101C